MVTFTELLTSTDSELVKIFYKIKHDSDDNFIRRINKIANQVGLNHAQLVCALGFNKNILDLTDIFSVLGFRSYKQLSYRQNELFTTDIYQQLSIENILDIYSERLEDIRIMESLRSLIIPRLTHIESDIDKNEDPPYIISYKMEIHAIYNSGIANKEFAENRVNRKDHYKYRKLTDEAVAIVESGVLPASNLFYMATVMPYEKKQLIERNHVPQAMIKNRLKNTKLTKEEQDLLESYI